MGDRPKVDSFRCGAEQATPRAGRLGGREGYTRYRYECLVFISVFIVHFLVCRATMKR